jgi:hypothetical protein
MYLLLLALTPSDGPGVDKLADHPTDHFGYLWHHGVSYRAPVNATHASGNPIIHNGKAGLSFFPSRLAMLQSDSFPPVAYTRRPSPGQPLFVDP